MPELRVQQVRRSIVATGLILTLSLVACSGPDEFGDNPQTPPPTARVTPAAEPSPTSSGSPTADTTPTSDDAEGSPTAGEAGETVADETPETTRGTPEPRETPTPEVEQTPTLEPLTGMDPLPRPDELSEAGYIVADEGERSQEQLAGAYGDQTAHLLRLEEWGFRQHVYREFTRQASDANQLPPYVLATVNVYGSPAQASDAFKWLEDLQLNQGAENAAAPEIGDAAVAITVATQEGIPTASVYVLYGSSTFVYYAQGGDPLPEVIAVAERVFERIGDDSRRAERRWPS